MSIEEAAEQKFAEELKKVHWLQRSAFKRLKTAWIHGFVCGAIYKMEPFRAQAEAQTVTETFSHLRPRHDLKREDYESEARYLSAVQTWYRSRMVDLTKRQVFGKPVGKRND